MAAELEGSEWVCWVRGYEASRGLRQISVFLIGYQQELGFGNPPPCFSYGGATSVLLCLWEVLDDCGKECSIVDNACRKWELLVDWE